MLKGFFEDILKQQREQIPFEHVNPVNDIGDNYIVYQTGDISFIFEVSGVEMERWRAEDYDTLNSQLSSIIRALPAGTIIQKQDIYYSAGERNNEKYKRYNNRIIHKIAENFKGREVLYHKSYLSVTLTGVVYKKNPAGSYFSLRKPTRKNPFENIEDRIKGAKELILSLQTALDSITGIEAKLLYQEEIKQVFYQYLNLEFESPQDSFSRQLNNEFSCFAVGEKKVNILSLTERGISGSEKKTVDASEVEEMYILPYTKNGRGIYAPYVSPLTHNLRCPHIINQVIQIRDTKKELDILDARRKRSDVKNQEIQIIRKDIENFTEKVRETNDVIVDFALQLIIFDIDDNRRQKSIRDAVNEFRSLNGSASIVESGEDSANLFFAGMPGNMSNNYRWVFPLSGKEALCYFNFTTNFRGDSSGDYLCDRFGKLVKIDFFNEEELNNPHTTIFGPSGSGKSALMAFLIGQRHARGEKQIIIDVGGTYKNLVTLLEGEYYEYDIEKPLKTNPFIIPKTDGKYVLNQDKENYILELMIEMWKGDQQISKVEVAILTKWIRIYYESLNQDSEDSIPSLAGFLDWVKEFDRKNKKSVEHCEDLEFFNIKEFLIIMGQYTQGIYKDALNSQQVDELGTNDLVCFDLQHIKKHEDLYRIVTKVIIELTNDFTVKYPDVLKWLYLEEAWSTIEDKLGHMVGTLFRTWRKHRGSVNMITQGIEEIEKSKIGIPMLNNSDTRIILNHKGQSEDIIERVARVLGLTRLEVDKLLSLRKEKYYREVLIKRLEKSDVFIVEMPTYVYTAVTSRPKERNMLRKLYEFYGNMENAINQFIEINYFEN